MPSKINTLTGWTLLACAALLGRTIANRALIRQARTRRNAALRGANTRGIPHTTLAAWTGLSPGHVKTILRPGARPDEDPGE